ncbi:MAG: outer membrane beta-barrel protein [Ignavibacterium sp.]|nr:MAG: outer membrane beta-barrel protein [Ignavibacterium sp.]
MKWIYLSIIILLVTASVSAQSFGSITYNAAVPQDNLRDFVDSESWRGFGVEGRWFQSSNLSFGLSFGWNVFDQRTNTPIQIQGSDIVDGENSENIRATVTGTQIRYVNSFPIMATGHFYIGKKRETIRIYGGAGVGTYHIKQRLEIGLVAFEENNWHFGIAPEAGLLLRFSRDVTMIFNIKYNYAFSSGKTVSGEDNDVAYWGFNIGFAWQSW